jgi:hypothetical protein
MVYSGVDREDCSVIGVRVINPTPNRSRSSRKKKGRDKRGLFLFSVA